MKNNLTVRLAIGLIVFSFFGVGVLTAGAQPLKKGADLSVEKEKSGAPTATVESDKVDDWEYLPCGRFPKENVFDSFEKAFLSPEKVRCFAPNFKDDDLSMKRLPSRFAALGNLEVFSFGCLEELVELPEEIGNLSKLTEIIIDNGNGCSMNVRVPASIGKLKNLRVLRLYGAIDSTDDLPDTLGELPRLEVLDLGRNGLTSLPPQIASLKNLKTLRLEFNSLSSVPDFVGDFKNLKELSLDSNGNISDLPASLSKLKGLTVSMGNNSLKLKDQKSLRTRFPRIVFSFEDEFDDASANETAPKPKPKAKARTKRKG